MNATEVKMSVVKKTYYSNVGAQTCITKTYSDYSCKNYVGNCLEFYSLVFVQYQCGICVTRREGKNVVLSSYIV